MDIKKQTQRKPSAIHWAKLAEIQKKRLLHLVARWFVRDKLSHAQIAKQMVIWVKTNARACYDPVGAVSNAFVGHHLRDAAQIYDFLQVKPFYEEDIKRQIQTLIPLYKGNIIVAPDSDELLQYVWIGLDNILTSIAKADPKGELVVGVSGGQTLLDLSEITRKLGYLNWHTEIPSQKRESTIICSLTSGGIRSNVAALSDTVSAIIGGYLQTQTRGLLGPAWFEDRDALTAFSKDPDVCKHKELVDNAKVIITSIGHLHDPKALMRQLLDLKGAQNFVNKQPYLADILYNLYDGQTGKPVKLPPVISDHLFSVVNLKQICQKVEEGTHCIVVARGKEKGKIALPGILKKKMANHIYMDRDCAEGLIQAL